MTFHKIWWNFCCEKNVYSICLRWLCLISIFKGGGTGSGGQISAQRAPPEPLFFSFFFEFIWNFLCILKSSKKIGFKIFPPSALLFSLGDTMNAQTLPVLEQLAINLRLCLVEKWRENIEMDAVAWKKRYSKKTIEFWLNTKSKIAMDAIASKMHDILKKKIQTGYYNYNRENNYTGISYSFKVAASRAATLMQKSSVWRTQPSQSRSVTASRNLRTYHLGKSNTTTWSTDLKAKMHFSQSIKHGSYLTD